MAFNTVTDYFGLADGTMLAKIIEIGRAHV